MYDCRPYSTSKKIPEKDLQSLIDSKTACAGVSCKLQLSYAILDQRMHTSKKVNKVGDRLTSAAEKL